MDQGFDHGDPPGEDGPPERKTTPPGCCERYHECPRCGDLFCKHGYLDPIPNKVKVIPWEKLCPECDALPAEEL